MLKLVVLALGYVTKLASYGSRLSPNAPFERILILEIPPGEFLSEIYDIPVPWRLGVRPLVLLSTISEMVVPETDGPTRMCSGRRRPCSGTSTKVSGSPIPLRGRMGERERSRDRDRSRAMSIGSGLSVRAGLLPLLRPRNSSRIFERDGMA